MSSHSHAHHSHSHHHHPAHSEKHFIQSELVRDIVLGAADGLTVPFALAAGLAGVLTATGIVVTAGIAEIAAGTIAMGLGGYLAAKSESDHFHSEYAREKMEVKNVPEREKEEVRQIFAGYGLSGDPLNHVVEALAKDEKRWIDFMMRYELGLEEPDPKRARTSAMTIGGAYLSGGFIPLLPYMLMNNMSQALIASSCITLAALLVFGGIKGHFTGVKPLRAGLETMAVGGTAAAVAFMVAKLVS
jgi:VIT1/CCC1 family predicted Fe2+/Mn2+ transporter